MIRQVVKALLRVLGLNPRRVVERICKVSLRLSRRQNGLTGMVERLRAIVPDISQQESSEAASFNDYTELKRRSLQAFQCSLMLKAVNGFGKGRLTVVDIGDSAGTHMLYLKDLTKGRFYIQTISVNLDPRAIEKIQARGLKAVRCRAEEFEWHQPVDLSTSFEMLEHLHNPALFLRHMAKRPDESLLLITVPYQRRSRVGLHHVRTEANRLIWAEDEHIFELNPEDWTLLMRHAGWCVVDDQVYFQYPRGWPVLSPVLAAFWRAVDYEGFWGALLRKDTALSDRYQDWE